MPSDPTLSQNKLVTPYGKLCIILFIVCNSGCEIEAGFSFIVLVGKPLQAKGSGNIIPFELKLVFCSCSVVSVFFLKFF